MGSTQPNPCGLGWVEFFLTHHSGFGKKILSTRPNLTMHTPTKVSLKAQN